MRGVSQQSTSNHRHLGVQHTQHMLSLQQFSALPSTERETIPQEENGMTATADTADANSSNNSGRLALLAGLVAVAALVLIASGGFGGLKERVKASRHLQIDQQCTVQCHLCPHSTQTLNIPRVSLLC
jgi:hypothetical protein